MKRIKGRLYYICENHHGLLYRKASFYDVDLESCHAEPLLKMPLGFLKRVAGQFGLLSRLLRLEPVCVERLSKQQYVVGCNHNIYLLNLKNSSLTSILSSREGFSTPLNICTDGNAVYWGEYGDNFNFDAVNVYSLGQDLSFKIVYTFPKGVIRHIHNIIWDIVNEQFFILTGDLENTSGIYTANKDWTEVKPLATGRQRFRAVVGFVNDDKLIYATDAVEEKNSIYQLQDGKVKLIADFPGSCIYGIETKDYFIFSSAVEPPEGRGLLELFTYKLGKGIKDRYTHLVTVRKNDLKVNDVFSLRKDIWPMKLFQYGTLMFPKGQEEGDCLWYYIKSCNGDGTSNQIRLNGE